MFGASWMPGTALIALHMLFLIFPATFQVGYSPHSRTEEAEAPAVIFLFMILGSGLVIWAQTKKPYICKAQNCKGC